MDYIDVVYPINLGPLTYRVPPDLASQIKPGMLISAEVKKTVTPGVVIGKSTNPPERNIKEITGILLDQPVLSEPMLRLLKWVADYYIVPAGLALKSILPVEVFKKTRPSGKQRPADLMPQSDNYDFPADLSLSLSDITAVIKKSASQKEYKTYLLHVPSMNHEISFAINAVKELRNAIILVPEISHIEMLAPFLKNIFGERMTVLHGQLTKPRKRNVFNDIITGKSDIVLGTRPAVFAPLSSVSLIAVLQEHNRSYKNMEGLRYHARDVAVMRGYLDKAAVLLSSPTPSIESYFNTTKGKYSLLSPDTGITLPKVEVINMKTSKKVTPYLSKRAIDAAAACSRKKVGVLFLINRKGFSMIQCNECNHIDNCPKCISPLVYHKDKRLLICHYCGHSSKLTETCRKCGSAKLDLIGAGTQRIASDIEKYLNIKAFRLDNDTLKENRALKSLPDIVLNEEMIVGTKIITGSLQHKKNLALCVFMNPDINLHLPDFRSPETLFQEFHSVSEHLMRNSLLIIQTRMPENHVYRHMRKHDYPSFYNDELQRRKSLSYPPFSRLALISVTSKNDISKMLTNVMRNTGAEAGDAVEAIGPVKLAGEGSNKWKILLKSQAKVSLHIYAHNFIKKLNADKGTRVVVDVDPVSI